MKIVSRIGRDGTLQISHRIGKVSQFDLRNGASIKRVGMIRARGNSLVVTRFGPRVVPVVEIQQSQLFVISCRRIVEDRSFQFLNPAAPREYLKSSAQ